jgi:hypothetical protein
MKYLITESQYNRINEISVYEGGMDPSESYESILTIIKNKIGNKKFKEEIKKYLKRNIGLSPKKERDDFSFKEYSRQIQGYDYVDKDEYNPSLFSTDVLSNMAYNFAKKYLKVEELGTLECYIEKSGNIKEYYFFDPELEMSVGSIKLYKNNYWEGDAWNVSLSSVDREVKGSGTGKSMYLALLDDVDVLFSDTTLYEDSLNIWVNVLPKICYVYALIDDSRRPKRILPSTKILNHENVKRYFATKDPSFATINQ